MKDHIAAVFSFLIIRQIIFFFPLIFWPPGLFCRLPCSFFCESRGLFFWKSFSAGMSFSWEEHLLLIYMVLFSASAENNRKLLMLCTENNNNIIGRMIIPVKKNIPQNRGFSAFLFAEFT
jgi:hypothetical protein